MNNYTKNYPRPQMIRERWINLNGEWEFMFDDEHVGETEGYFHRLPASRHIIVPFSYETKLSGIGEEDPHGCVWYQRNVEIYPYTDHRRMLIFEGSDYRTKVWINGTFVGEHLGGSERFSFDITETLKEGSNTITVEVLDSFCVSQPRGKQRWGTENFGCWYVQTTGIWKTVWMEEVPSVHIGGIKITPSLQRACADAVIEIEEDGKSEGLTIEARVTFEGIPVSVTENQVIDGKAIQILSVLNRQEYVWGFHQWSPENPSLYDVTFALKRDGHILDQVKSYFGMREIRIDEGKILLNGVPLYQKLILDQGYWKESGLTPPSEEALTEDIDKIRRMGFNGVRKHMKIEDERFLYWCDVKGILVWSEMPATYSFDDLAIKSFTSEWIDIVRQNYNHPCIITWTPFNESWGVPDIKTSKVEQAFTKMIYYLTKSMDPMRPVITNDGWEHTISDILTLHDYEEDGDIFRKKYAEKELIVTNEIYHAKVRSAFADGYHYQGQPIIISEYGGIAFEDKGDGQWGYGDAVRTETEFLERYRKITSAIQSISYISGYCYTQVSDVQQEVNGLLMEDRKYKIDPEKIAAINRAV
ncbi:MAG: glycoside hydrolase family 2 [Lachnospiraceae bacterium]|nr:glycoside hydrolase family 2 [Lachnospiraceae bacterium]